MNALVLSLFVALSILIISVQTTFPPPGGCTVPNSPCAGCISNCGLDCLPGTSIPKAALPLISCPYPGTSPDWSNVNTFSIDDFTVGVEKKIQMSGGSATNYFIIENVGTAATLEITSCTRAVGGKPDEEDNKQHIPIIIAYDAITKTPIAAGTVCDVTGGVAQYCSYVYLSSVAGYFPNKILVAGYSLTKNQLITNYNTPISPNRCGSGMLPNQSLYVKVLSNGGRCEVESIRCPLIGTFVQQKIGANLFIPALDVTMNPPNCQSSNIIGFTTTARDSIDLYCEDIGNYTYTATLHDLECTGDVRILSALYIFAYYHTEPFFVDYSDPSTAVCAFLNTGNLCNVPSNRFRPRIYTFSGCYHSWEIQDYYWYANSTNLVLGELYYYWVYAQDPSGNGAWNKVDAVLHGINVLTLSPTDPPISSNIYEINVHSEYTLEFAIYFDFDTSYEIYNNNPMQYFIVLIPTFINNVAGRVDPKMLDLFFPLVAATTAGNDGLNSFLIESDSFTISDHTGYEDLKTLSQTYYIAVITCYSPFAIPEYRNDPHDPDWYTYGYYYARGYSYGEIEYLYDDYGYFLEAIYPFYEYFKYDYPFPNEPKEWPSGGLDKRGGSFCDPDELYISYANPVVKLNFDSLD